MLLDACYADMRDTVIFPKSMATEVMKITVLGIQSGPKELLTMNNKVSEFILCSSIHQSKCFDQEKNIAENIAPM